LDARTAIDLNADVGEWSDLDVVDALLMPHLSSANIACGVHAGNRDVMRATVRRAQRYDVAIGAHPGLADVDGFGRRETPIEPADAARLVLTQVRALAEVAKEAGLPLRHVKLHGGLYHMAGRDRRLADAVVEAIASINASLRIFAMPGSETLQSCARAGMSGVAEGFADRAYRSDGTLVPRAVPGAVIENPDEVVARAVRLATDGTIVADDGAVLSLAVESICVHGDTPGAPALAAQVRGALERAGIAVRAPASAGG
jgi:UPF0271 protein